MWKRVWKQWNEVCDETPSQDYGRKSSEVGDVQFRSNVSKERLEDARANAMHDERFYRDVRLFATFNMGHCL